MTRNLGRLFNPKSIAVIGGGAWGTAVIAQLRRMGYQGEIWPVHPAKTVVADLPAYSGVPDLPGVPDAAFVGINRDASIGAVERLRRAGAGGAVCFASGFAEVSDGDDLNARLLKAAGDMPILGPNCYGFVNALDGVALWPDQQGMRPADRGVAILTQSSNIAINLTMQARGLPIGMMITCGNQAQTSQADIAAALLNDPRITAIGLHVEGFGDLTAWQTLARRAQKRGIPLVALKAGRSEAAQRAAISHTAALAGADAGADALLERLGIARLDDLTTLIETLKILHLGGPLPDGNIATISCSGGEASLAADLATDLPLSFPPLTPGQSNALSTALGPRVALDNPLDYHTYIWRDTAAMTKAFTGMLDPGLSLTTLIVDFPRPDRCDPVDWDCVIAAARDTQKTGRGRLAVCATLPELLPEATADRLIADGVIPLAGLRTGLTAMAAAVRRVPVDLELDLPPSSSPGPARVLTEDAAKDALAAHGLACPASQTLSDIGQCTLRYPIALKGLGVAHKSDSGAVALNLATPEALHAAAETIPADTFLAEEMVAGGVAELLVAVMRDPAHGLALTLGAGGTLTELWQDTTHLLLPSSPDAIRAALMRLRIAPLLTGFRNAPAADLDAAIAAILAIQSYALANAARLEEVEVNPLICTPDTAIAVDALIRISDD